MNWTGGGRSRLSRGIVNNNDRIQKQHFARVKSQVAAERSSGFSVQQHSLYYSDQTVSDHHNVSGTLRASLGKAGDDELAASEYCDSIFDSECRSQRLFIF
jgi:hypothetical protein